MRRAPLGSGVGQMLRCGMDMGKLDLFGASTRPGLPIPKKKASPRSSGAGRRVPFLVFPMLVTLRNILLTLRHISIKVRCNAGLRVML
jgi:hypothetical protein